MRLALCLIVGAVRAPAEQVSALSDPSKSCSESHHVRGTVLALAAETLSALVRENQVVIFSRSGSDSASRRVKTYFEDAGIPYYSMELDQRADADSLKKVLAERTGSGRTPAVYVRGQHISECNLKTASKTGELEHWDEIGPLGARGVLTDGNTPLTYSFSHSSQRSCAHLPS